MSRMPEPLSRRWRALEGSCFTLLFRIRRQPVPPRPLRVIFVCQGNICRSPFAEAWFRRSIPTIEVLSAGFDARAGNVSPYEAVRVARRHGVDLGTHRARLLNGLTGRPGDLWFVMEPWHARVSAVRRAGGSTRPQLLGRWLEPPQGRIPDPYGGDWGVFETCYAQIAAALAPLAESWSDGRAHGRG